MEKDRSIPKMRSWRVGKASEEGGVLDACVNSISGRRNMNLTIHNGACSFKIPSDAVVWVLLIDTAHSLSLNCVL